MFPAGDDVLTAECVTGADRPTHYSPRSRLISASTSLSLTGRGTGPYADRQLKARPTPQPRGGKIGQGNQAEPCAEMPMTSQMIHSMALTTMNENRCVRKAFFCLSRLTASLRNSSSLNVPSEEDGLPGSESPYGLVMPADYAWHPLTHHHSTPLHHY
jgi:hypothetical protein